MQKTFCYYDHKTCPYRFEHRPSPLLFNEENISLGQEMNSAHRKITYNQEGPHGIRGCELKVNNFTKNGREVANISQEIRSPLTLSQHPTAGNISSMQGNDNKQSLCQNGAKCLLNRIGKCGYSHDIKTQNPQASEDTKMLPAESTSPSATNLMSATYNQIGVSNFGNHELLQSPLILDKQLNHLPYFTFQALSHLTKLPVEQLKKEIHMQDFKDRLDGTNTSRDIPICILKICSKLLSDKQDSTSRSLLSLIAESTFLLKLSESLSPASKMNEADNRWEYEKKYEFYDNLVDVLSGLLDLFPSKLNALPIEKAIISINQFFNCNYLNEIEVAMEDIDDNGVGMSKKALRVKCIALKKKHLAYSNQDINLKEEAICGKRKRGGANFEESYKEYQTEDFKDISLIPGEKELTEGESLFRYIRKMPSIGDLRDKRNYLDILFRHLYEDATSFLKNGLNLMQVLGKNQANLSKNDLFLKAKNANITIDEAVRMKGIEVQEGVACLQFRFKVDPRKFTDWRNSKRHKPGSLVILSHDQFRTYYVGILRNRDADSMNLTHERDGFVDISIQIISQGSREKGLELLVLNFAQRYISSEFQIIESSAYFESYNHVLKSLKERDYWNTLPFARNIINGSREVPAPRYSRGIELLIAPQIDPELPEFQLDDSQRVAMEHALKSEIALIQGPPGTGKTFVGVQLVKHLLANKEVWRKNGPILLVTYTQHALEQFLLLVKRFTQKIVRIGGKSQEPELQKFGLKEMLYKDGLDGVGLRRELQSCKFKVNQNYKLFTFIEAGIISSFLDNEDIQSILEDLSHYFPPTLQQAMYKLGVFSEDQIQAVKAHFQELRDNTFDDILIAIWLGIVDLEAYLKEFINSYNNQKHIKKRHSKEHTSALDQVVLIEENKDNQNENQGVSSDNEKMPFLDQLKLRTTTLDSIFNQNNCHHLINSRPQTFFECSQYIRQQPFNEDTSPTELIDLLLNNFEQKNPFSMKYSINKRWAINNFLMEQQKEFAKKQISKDFAAYQHCDRVVEQAQKQRSNKIFNEMDILAMTTTGRSKYSSLLDHQEFPIVIVEEAAQVFEAHVITSLSKNTQHLILIGDHLQLKPTPAVHDLAVNYNMNLSMFERLVNNKIPHVKLLHQRRMRPEISNIMRIIYPDLKDHDVVLGLPQVKGVQQSLYFFDHDFPEETNERVMSKVNFKEAQIVVRFTIYLLQQGYHAENITILTLYTGQLLEIKNLIRHEPFFYDIESKIRVVNVDNYQGEENDIIILSLVRSNPENKLGFLEISNRVCVALSRARMGLYIFGNASCLLASKLQLWTDIVHYLKKNRFFGKSLKFQCKQHKKATEAECYEDFHKVPEGGCSQACNIRMPCGHSCESTCHPYEITLEDETGHKKNKCAKDCLRKTDCGHQCSFRCYQCIEGHKGCITLVWREMEACKHSKNIYCYQNNSSYQCLEPCQKVLPCGHNCTLKCYEQCSGMRCIEMVKRTLVCGHTVEMPCKENPKTFPCSHLCKQLLQCAHPCNAKCHQSGQHGPCSAKCSRTLVCGHECQYPCTKNCPPCEMACKTECPHSKCGMACGNECILCMEPCEISCKHSKCTKRCSEPCDRKPCDEKCDQKLACGHTCIGLCGEKCPPICRICQPDHETFQVFFGEEQVADRFVEIDCGHIFEMEALDRYMSNQSAAVKYKRCPRCNSQISKCYRYLEQINETLNDINKIKAMLNNDASKLKQMFKDIKFQLSKIKETKKMFLSQGHQDSLYEQRIIDQIDDLIVYAEISRSAEMGTQIIQDLEYLTVIQNIRNISFQITDSQRAPYEQHFNQLDEGLKKCTEDNSQIPTHFQEAKKTLATLKGKFPHVILPEIKYIMKAVGLSASHWNKCPNGHYYVIADCGGAMEESKCPDCGSTIGGKNHKLTEGNSHASELGGAAAWDPDGFNAQVADGRINLQERFGQ